MLVIHLLQINENVLIEIDFCIWGYIVFYCRFFGLAKYFDLHIGVYCVLIWQNKILACLHV